jgi:hypothetical protein
MLRLAQDVIFMWVAYTRGAAEERRNAKASMQAVQNDYEVRLARAYQQVEETDANLKHVEQIWQQAQTQADSCQEQLVEQNEMLQSAHDALAALQLEQASALTLTPPVTPVVTRALEQSLSSPPAIKGEIQGNAGRRQSEGEDARRRPRSETPQGAFRQRTPGTTPSMQAYLPSSPGQLRVLASPFTDSALLTASPRMARVHETRDVADAQAKTREASSAVTVTARPPSIQFGTKNEDEVCASMSAQQSCDIMW